MKDVLISRLPDYDLQCQLAQDLKEFWQDKVVFVKSLPAVARWVSSSGGTLNNALFRFPKEQTLEKRFLIFVKMIGWIRYCVLHSSFFVLDTLTWVILKTFVILNFLIPKLFVILKFCDS
jgi:hypothetical protein